MKNNVKKIFLLFLCIAFLGGEMPVRAAGKIGESEIGIVFGEAYQDNGQKGNGDKNNDNKQSNGGNEIKGKSTSTAAQKKSLPQTGERKSDEKKAGFGLAALTVFLLGMQKRPWAKLRQYPAGIPRCPKIMGKIKVTPCGHTRMPKDHGQN